MYYRFTSKVLYIFSEAESGLREQESRVLQLFSFNPSCFQTRFPRLCAINSSFIHS